MMWIFGAGIMLAGAATVVIWAFFFLCRHWGDQ
jgi:hypothetical protein